MTYVVIAPALAVAVTVFPFIAALPDISVQCSAALPVRLFERIVLTLFPTFVKPDRSKI